MIPVLASPMRNGLLVLAGIAALIVGAWALHGHIEQSGYDRAVAERAAADARKLKADAVAAGRIESSARAANQTADDTRHKETHDAQVNLANLQSRAAVGAVRLRCPAVVLPVAAPESGPVAGGSSPSFGPDVVPAAAVDVLAIAGSIAEDMRRYQALVQRFDQCRAAANWDPE